MPAIPRGQRQRRRGNRRLPSDSRLNLRRSRLKIWADGRM